MRTWLTIGLCVWAGMRLAVAGNAPQQMASHDIVIEFEAVNGVPISDVELWVSRDSGRDWQKAVAERTGDTAVRYFAPENGRYDFYLVLRNDAGASAEPPAPGSTPVASIVVDTVPPLLQLHEARIEPVAAGSPTIIFDVSLVEENLSDTGVRVFYRTEGGPWTDGGPVVRCEKTLTWQAPDDLGSPADFRVVATDLAGNSAASELPDVAVPLAEASALPDPMAAETPTAPDTPDVAVSVEPVTIAPVEPPVVEHAAAAGEAATATPSRPTPVTDLDRLHTLANQFMREGRHDLAAARLEDALRVAPGDADTLVDLGSAMYRLQRYDEARGRFDEALQAAPDHSGALEGLALVAATQRRYPDAREHLQHLLKLRPDSGANWLRYGDIEHRLGNAPQAFEAWERVLKLSEADEAVREKARRRLAYFRAGRSPE